MKECVSHLDTEAETDCGDLGDMSMCFSDFFLPSGLFFLPRGEGSEELGGGEGPLLGGFLCWGSLERHASEGVVVGDTTRILVGE